MLETQYCLAWEQHSNNIAFGLNKLQQDGEFVDMTLAADGYFVKVHQMVLSLVSPYIKEIIKSTKCAHPVIFLNKISYKTLCSILDFIYKGEVEVGKNGLDDLIQAGKDLQIKGLQEMNCHALTREENSVTIQPSSSKNETIQDETATYVENKVKSSLRVKPPEQLFTSKNDHPTSEDEVVSEVIETEEIELFSEEIVNIQDVLLTKVAKDSLEAREKMLTSATSNNHILDISKETSTPLYTISLQGFLQLVLDNFLYNLKYYSPTASNHCQWKCVDYVKNKCPAFTVTRNDCVIQNVATHTHPPHVEKISKKMLTGEIFTTYKTASEYSQIKKNNKNPFKQVNNSKKKLPKL